MLITIPIIAMTTSSSMRVKPCLRAENVLFANDIVVFLVFVRN